MQITTLPNGIRTEHCSDMGCGDFLNVYLPNGKVAVLYASSVNTLGCAAVGLYPSIDALESGDMAALECEWGTPTGCATPAGEIQVRPEFDAMCCGASVVVALPGGQVAQVYADSVEAPGCAAVVLWPSVAAMDDPAQADSAHQIDW